MRKLEVIEDAIRTDAFLTNAKFDFDCYEEAVGYVGDVLGYEQYLADLAEELDDYTDTDEGREALTLTEEEYEYYAIEYWLEQQED